MVSEIEVTSSVLVSTRERVPWPELGPRIRVLFDRIYAFARRLPLSKTGQNVCIYSAPQPDSVLLECGVQIAAPFAAEGELLCSSTPSGRAAWTVHHGPYHRLPEAHDLLRAWLREHELPAPGPSWEVYGDWTDDPDQLRTDVYWLISSNR
jgi:effector-binding domain-containing protein